MSCWCRMSTGEGERRWAQRLEARLWKSQHRVSCIQGENEATGEFEQRSDMICINQPTGSTEEGQEDKLQGLCSTWGKRY